MVASSKATYYGAVSGSKMDKRESVFWLGKSHTIT